MDSRIIASHDALSESYIPGNILHRQKKLAQLSNAINVVNTFVYGPSGSGKTLLIKKAIARIDILTPTVRFIFEQTGLGQSWYSLVSGVLILFVGIFWGVSKIGQAPTFFNSWITLLRVSMNANQDALLFLQVYD